MSWLADIIQQEITVTLSDWISKKLGRKKRKHLVPPEQASKRKKRRKKGRK